MVKRANDSYKDLKAFAAFARSPPCRISVMSELTCQTTLKINKLNPPGTSARNTNNAASEHNKTVLMMPAPNISVFALGSADISDCELVCAVKKGKRSKICRMTGG